MPDVIDGQEGDEMPPLPDREEPTPTPKPEPEHTDKPDASEPPKDEPVATEKPKPDSGVLNLDAWAKEAKIKLSWTPYSGDGFGYYKVVRSPDATVSWPECDGEKDCYKSRLLYCL